MKKYKTSSFLYIYYFIYITLIGEDMEIKILNNEEIEIKGIKKIIEITQTEASLLLEISPLIIKGEDLTLVKSNNELDTIILKGKISSLDFKTKKSKDNFFKKLFS